MAEHNEHSAEHAGSHGGHDDAHHINYKKIYFTLLALLVVSIIGPEFGILWVTLVTAFGIAFVKANLVIQNFMHLRPEKAVVKWMLASSLLLMGLFFFGVAPDVMKHEGRNWEHLAAKAVVERGIPLDEAYGGPASNGEEGDGMAAEEPAPEVAEAPFSAQGAYNTTCALCHGATGGGDGPGGAALDPQPASFNTTEYWAGTTDERMFNVIKNGGPAEGLSPLMAAWGPLYDDDEVRQIVEYIKTFQP